jgi:hypothetical protein
MFGVHVRGDEVDRLACAHLGYFAQHRLRVAGAHAGVDDQHGLLANDDADVWNERGTTIGYGPDVARELLRDAFAYQRGLRNGLLGEGRSPGKCGDRRG